MELVSNHSAEMLTFVSSIPDERSGYAYAAGKWTIAQMLQHMIDTERIFVYRLLWILRGGKQPLPGFDENDFADAATAADRSFQALKEEFSALRRSTDLMVAALSPKDLAYIGEVSGAGVTANAICFMIYGHTLHHLKVLKERYS